ncbi:Saposin-like_type B domin-containing protein [Hexamita inflata]|uniref:Saposin-like type B domin-containing protein n=1 Tax=Hexamita inflata TaxID=28002 RepID=A0AA86QCV7_9EUKA|nr:Saposin-like type B domin-containing protein [Hexamita inflata]
MFYQFGYYIDVYIVALSKLLNRTITLLQFILNEAFLTGVCQYVPHDIFGWCEELIKVYYQQLIESILDGFPPYEVCESVKLC